MNNNLNLFYGVYLATSIGLTAWLAVVLNRNGRIFLRDVFSDDPDIGAAVNRLLTIGFFMLNLGYAFLILRAESINPSENLIAFLVNRLGLLLVSLGILHFVNMAVFAKIRRHVRLDDLPPPVPPQVLLPPPDRPDPAGHAHDDESNDRYGNEPVAAGRQPRARFIDATLPPPPPDPWAPAGR
ncbi:MAG: hypothetical protein HYX32_08185 [Actinobacteria bacterium]|nr:hypothetical protein [Actinomycetota bacterium]